MNNEYSKSYYKIKDVAEFINESPSTLRYWESEFPNIIKPVRNSGKIRYYTPEVIEQIKKIKYLLRDRGLKIEAVKTEMRTNGKNVSKRMKILSTLEDLKTQLLIFQDALKARR